MSRLPEPLNRFIEERSPMTTPLSVVDNEEGPDITRLMIRAGEASNSRIILGNKENRLVEIPLDFRRRDERRIFEPIFGGSVPHLVNARQVEPSSLAQAQKHVAPTLAGAENRGPAFQRPLQATPEVSNAASAIASRGPRFAHKTNWND
jgi:hypothetical protein